MTGSAPRKNAPPCTIVWFRQDLRTDDNPALAAACEAGAIVPVYIWSPEEEGGWAPGGASRVWLHASLAELDKSMARLGAPLVFRRGPSLEVLRALIAETGARAVVWNRRYEPAAVIRDIAIKSHLKAEGIEVRSFNGSLLFEPWEIANREGKPYQVFTPFWNTCLARPEPAPPLAAPSHSVESTWRIDSLSLGELELMPRIPWEIGIRSAWTPGEAGARKNLERFIEESMSGYSESRDIPGTRGTSRLSPHLHFGEISPRRIWHCIIEQLDGELGVGAETFLKELGWREFAHHVLHHFPRVPEQPLRVEFEQFPWNVDSKALRLWQRGQTGYPIVDAGMRELWQTGWMHNRVRMIVSSFLTKHLRISWLDGARWFWDTLVDADLANNSLGWQWSAGCGADAAPYFRVFNPMLQGAKFDPKGEYARRWVPELAQLPDKWIHRPWEAPSQVVAGAGITLGANYPQPIVDHRVARESALRAFAEFRGS